MPSVPPLRGCSRAAVAALPRSPPPPPRPRPRPSATPARRRTASASARPPTSPRAPPSFDGTPIDVDVTLPGHRRRPVPDDPAAARPGRRRRPRSRATGGDQGYNNCFFAQQGYAVVTPTARGFGDSCGTLARGPPSCARGWTRLGDMRYEVRDIQTLVGQLVDEGVADPDAIGSTGISYGGGFSTMLAFLQATASGLPDGGYAPWTSPKGTPIALTAAWPRWLWSNGETIFTRNGRGPWSRTPTGVEAQAYAGGDLRASPSAASSRRPAATSSTDITLWKPQLDAGTSAPRPSRRSTTPTTTTASRASRAARRRRCCCSPAGPTRCSRSARRSAPTTHSASRDPTAPVALQVGDLGHAPAANHPEDVAAFDAQRPGVLRRVAARAGGAKPAPGVGHGLHDDLPGDRARRAAAPTRPRRSPRWPAAAALAGRRAAEDRRPRAASAKLAAAVSPLATGSHCAPHDARPRRASAVLSRRSPGVTLIGQPVITGRVAAKGRYGQLDARVWDRDPARRASSGSIDRGAYRLDATTRRGASASRWTATAGGSPRATGSSSSCSAATRRPTGPARRRSARRCAASA